MGQCKTLAVDLAKNSFYLFALKQQGKAAGKKKLSRTQFLV